MEAWHFIRADLCCRYDGVPVVPGAWLEVQGPPRPCEHGLHASESIMDALRYAPGPILCRVELDGEIVRGSDKVVATRRRVLWWADASRLLRECACDWAERACRLAGWTDPRSLAAIEVARRYARGEATEAELRDAGDAAWAARAAAWDAAWDAARVAAWAAAWAARAGMAADLETRVMERARGLGLAREVCR